MVNAFLEQMNINIAPFGKNEAIKAAKNNKMDWNFSKNAREYIIGSTAILLNAKLITNNLKSFKWLNNALTPDEIMENY